MKLSRKQKKAQQIELAKREAETSINEGEQELPSQITPAENVPSEPEQTISSEAAAISATTRHTSVDHPPETSSITLAKRLKLSYFIWLLFPLVAFALYSNALDTNFVFDDEVNIETVKAIKMTTLSWDNLVKAGTDGLLNKRPLANISFALNHYFGGLSTRGYHIVNILIHALNGIILYLLFTAIFQTPVIKKRYGPPGLVPLAAALIWLVHPVQVQSVTYIVQRMNSMASMFYFLGVLCYIYSRLTNSSRNKWIFLGLSFFSALLGMATKEIVASIPFALLLVEFVLFQNFNPNWLKTNLLKIGIIVVFFLGLAFWFVDGNPMSRIFAPYVNLPYSASQRVLTEFRVVLFYLKQLFLGHPFYLNILHDFPVSTSMFQPVTTLLSFLAIVGSMLGAALISRKAPLLFLAIFWYFGTLVIESSVINLEIIYEHRSYLPSIFVILAVVTYISKIIPSSLARKTLFVAIISTLCFWTYSRNAVWADEIAFWQDCIDKNPKASRAYNDLANAYAMIGEKKKAVQIYYQGMHLNYNDWKMHYNLAVILESLWETDKAIEQFNWVVRAKPKFGEAHFRLGMIYARNKDYQKAVWHTKEALRLNPDLTSARTNLITYQKWAKSGRTQ